MKIKWKTPRGYKKNEMLYQDRGMLKYQSLILHEHTEVIEEHKENTKVKSERIYYENKRNYHHLEVLKRAKEDQREVTLMVIKAKKPLKILKGKVISIDRDKFCMVESEGETYKINMKDLYSAK